MPAPRWLALVGGVVLLSSGTLMGQTEDRPSWSDSDPFAHPDCPWFGPQRERSATDALRKPGGVRESHPLSLATEAVTAMLPYAPRGNRNYVFDRHETGTID